MLGKWSGIKYRNKKRTRPRYLFLYIYTSKKNGHIEVFTQIYTRENDAVIVDFFSSSSNVHKEKRSQFIYNRETYRKENHRWNNDVYCSIENRRYTNIYIYRKRHETVL